MDVDIDCKIDFVPEDHFPVIRASRVEKGTLKRHNVGVYFQNIPVDGMTNLSAIPYKCAEDYGFMKIDFLHLDLLSNFTTQEQIKKLIAIEPDWSILMIEEKVKKMFQISKQYDLIYRVKPESIIELADCLALMRPGKRQLLEQYLKNPDEVRQVLYISNEKFTFKRSHAIAYAHNIVLQMHLMKYGVI